MSKSHANTSKYVDTVTIFQNFNKLPHTMAGRYSLYIPTIGKRRPDRPRTSCLACVWGLHGDSEGAVRERQVAALACGRHAWRNLVVACSAADGWWWRMDYVQNEWSHSLFSEQSSGETKRRTFLEAKWLFLSISLSGSIALTTLVSLKQFTL